MSHNVHPNNMHVITENGEQCFMWRNNQLTYIAQDRNELPLVLATKFGSLATKLDLSYNTLTSYEHINLFTNLNELILDNNCLEDDRLDFRQNLRLKTLSLNKNKLTQLYRLIKRIKICFPNLEFLSLIGNPLCPSALAQQQQQQQPPANGSSDCTDNSRTNLPTGQVLNPTVPDLPIGSTAHDLDEADFAYQKYRYFIIYHLPNLRFLDSSPVSGKERDEALRRCYWMKGFELTEQTSNDELMMVADGDQQESNINNGHQDFQLTIMSDYDRQNEGALEGQTRGSFSRLSYKYTGKNSEGNRFIKNNDL